MQLMYSTVPAKWVSFGESYPSAEMQLVYSTAPANWTKQISALISCQERNCEKFHHNISISLIIELIIYFIIEF